MTETRQTRNSRRSGAIPEAFRYNVRLTRVESWLDEHYAADASLGAAARVVGLNAKYFSKFFHEKTGLYFSDWVRSIRIEKAMQRMRAGDCCITTVAFDVGFNDLRTFERVFKKQTGLTPRAYRERVRPESSSIAGDDGRLPRVSRSSPRRADKESVTL